MGVLTINRPVDSGAPAAPAAPAAAADATTTTTATYLSQESLTFPVITSVASFTVLVINAVTGAKLSNVGIAIVGAVFGGLLIVYGFVSQSGLAASKPRYFGQIFVGLCNTILLIAALLGVAEVAATN